MTYLEKIKLSTGRAKYYLYFGYKICMYKDHISPLGNTILKEILNDQKLSHHLNDCYITIMIQMLYDGVL